jgi:hypothetical protein
MLTRQVSLVQTHYRAPVASLRKETQAISSAIGVVANRKGKQPSFRVAKSPTAAICRPC